MLLSAYKILHERLALREDTEHEQAIIRATIAGLIFLYVASQDFRASVSVAYFYSFFYVLVSTGFIVAIFLKPKPSPIRRVLGILWDMGSLTFGLYIAGEKTAILYPIYLWVIFGNGFRFGRPYLYISSLFALISFSFVVYANPYWRNMFYLDIGLLAALIILPAYVSSLLRKLENAIQKAEQANQAKSRFLAAMSHELRTPLTAIIGNSDVLRTTELDGEQKDMTQTIKTSASALLAIINDILDFSKIEANQMQSEVIEFDFYKLLHDTRNMLDAQATAKNVRLNLCLSADLPLHVRGDQQHLRQVLINLMGNAIKFTETGSVTLFACAVNTASVMNRVMIEVVDTGIGIPEDKLEKIFESFSQVDESVARKYGGTGLGLSISKQLVSLMGGELKVESTLGKGSRFWFELEFEAIRRIEADNRPDFPILLVRDAASFINSPLPQIQARGFQISEVNSGPELEAQLAELARRRQKKAVILIDGQKHADTLPFAGELNWMKIRKCGVVLAAYASAYDLQNLPPFLKQECLGVISQFDTTTLNHLLLNAAHRLNPMEADGESVERLRERFASAASGLRILVAEDNTINRKVTGKILQRAGHHVALAQNGEEALDILDKEDFDVVLVDMNMPVVSGIEVMQLYRYGHTDKIHIPFIAFTADATYEAKKQCEDAGFNGFLTKPIEPDLLLSEIDRIAGRPTAEASALPAPADDPDTDTSPEDFLSEKSIPAEPIRDVPVKETGTMALPQQWLQNPEMDITFGSNDNATSPEDFSMAGFHYVKLVENVPVINPQDIENLKGLSPEPGFFREIVTDFLRDGTDLLNQMEKALDDKDPKAFDDVAHALKSSTANIGARRFYQYLVQYRTMDHTDFELQAHEFYQIFRDEFELAKLELKKYLSAETVKLP